MRYSEGFRRAVLKRALPPESMPISSICREFGICEQTVRTWIEKAKTSTIEITNGEIAPNDRHASEKLKLVLESKRVEADRMGEWLRERGLHTEHLALWEQELDTIVTDKDEKLKAELAATKRKLKETERELTRKEKALAEMAALLALKKKADEIWGDDEED